jgi:hypothetical protein
VIGRGRLSYGCHVLLLVLGASSIADGQDRSAGGNVDITSSRWLWHWSPLRPIGDLALPAPHTPDLPRTLDLPAPRVGLLWSAGNPAGLVDEVDSAWTQLASSVSGISGSYHRPLEAPRSSASGVSIAGWRPVGRRSFAIGRAALEREDVGAGGYAAVVRPYGSSPFVPSDTNRPAVVRPVVTLEGAQGIALGRWRLGLAAGYRAQENNSSQSSAAQLGRTSSTGLTIGASRMVGHTWKAGLHARHLIESEALTLVANPGTIRLYPLNGYLNVDPQDITPLAGAALRRTDRSEDAIGAAIAGDKWGATWTLYGEQQSLAERQIADISSKPPTDRWHTRGYAGGAAMQRRAKGAVATFRAEYTSQSGNTYDASSRQKPFHAGASQVTAATDIRHWASDSVWQTAVLLSLVRQHQNARDDAARASTTITSWQPAVAVDVTRVMTKRIRFGLGLGVEQYTPYATLPEPRGRGKAYETLLAPAIEVAAATARSYHEAITVQWKSAAALLTFRLWRATTAPTTRPASSLVPLSPGSRKVTGIAVSLAPGR